MILLITLLLLSFTFGQEVIKLTPQKAYELALKNNAELKKLRYEIESINSQWQEAKNYFLPYITLGAGILYNSKTQDWEKSFGVSFVNVLYEYRKTASRIKSAELRHEIKQEALKQLERDIKLRILELFTKASLYKKLTEVKREEMAIAYVRYDRARQKKDLGVSTNLEVYQLESIYREKRKDLLNAQYEYNKALLDIKKLTGLDMNALIDVEDLDFKPKVGEIDKDKLLEQAIKNNPIVKIKTLEVKLYEEMIEEANNIMAPRVQFRGELGNSIRAGTPQTRAFNQNGWRAGIEIFMPLFDPTSLYKMESLTSYRKIAQVELEDTINEFKLLSNSADYRYSYLLAQWDFALARSRFAEENLTLRRSEYELELAFDLGYAMAEKSEAERQLMQAKYDILLFLARLYHLAGLDPFLVLEKNDEFIKAN
ncbi:TolC family protein [Hydrogenobacter hydrogenophilus]|uniref:Outer membrane protein TolC n=1 Tax=Hydrogenobacter hydrogenophilus TaxID=35835 RepID=A0A285NXM3_9AQUI|nr:TolC family protein [Hydrogenobacter hydrogenophilus]SNZ13673.1 Outer membrane protein TolC [Hydrogenobacter hydrogenophilus]